MEHYDYPSTYISKAIKLIAETSIKFAGICMAMKLEDQMHCNIVERNGAVLFFFAKVPFCFLWQSWQKFDQIEIDIGYQMIIPFKRNKYAMAVPPM